MNHLGTFWTNKTGAVLKVNNGYFFQSKITQMTQKSFFSSTIKDNCQLVSHKNLTKTNKIHRRKWEIMRNREIYQTAALIRIIRKIREGEKMNGLNYTNRVSLANAGET